MTAMAFLLQDRGRLWGETETNLDLVTEKEAESHHSKNLDFHREETKLKSQFPETCIFPVTHAMHFNQFVLLQTEL